MAHARRKFFDLHVTNKSQLAERALHSIGGSRKIERHTREMRDGDRWRLRQETAAPIIEKLHEWMVAQRETRTRRFGYGQGLDYSLRRWLALTRYLEDGAVPIDNNQIENLIRPWALGRSNWLFAGSQGSGKRAAAIMSLIQSARMNGHDPYAYLKGVLLRLPELRATAIKRCYLINGCHCWCREAGVLLIHIAYYPSKRGTLSDSRGRCNIGGIGD